MLRIRLDKTANENEMVIRRNCNLNCIWCHNDYFKHNGFISISNDKYLEIIQRVINVSEEKDSYIRLGGNGDPLCVIIEDLCDLIVKLKSLQFVNRVDITTNGTLLEKYYIYLKESGVDSITISINSLKRNTYREITGKDLLPNVLKGISLARDIGIKMKINVIYSSFNESEFDLYEDLSSNFEIPIKFFDLIYTKRTRVYYRPLENIQVKLKSKCTEITYQQVPYSREIYKLASGAEFQS